MEKHLLKASDIVLWLVSICFFILRDIICLFDLSFALIRDFTASKAHLVFALCSLKSAFQYFDLLILVSLLIMLLYRLNCKR